MSTTATARPRVMIITTSHETLGAFFGRQLTFLASHGFDMHAVCSPGPGLDYVNADGASTVHAVRMERKPNLLRDLISLVTLWLLILRVRPGIVHAHTPKAGLLGMLAALFAFVPVRLYTIHGLPLVTRKGLMRRILVLAEKMSCGLATRVYTVSSSLRDVVLELHLCPARKLFTLGDGSCAGIDLERFDPAVDHDVRRAKMRSQFEIPADALVLTFVGRVARDKGIEILAQSWDRLQNEFPDLYLLLCGAFDSTDPVPQAVLDSLRSHPRVRFSGDWVDDVPAVYAASDISVLPTFREGLSQVALESAAMEVPIVSSRIPGLVNSVRDGVTGLLVPPSDPDALTDAVRRLCSDKTLRRQLALAGRRFVRDRFSQERVNNLVLADYLSLLGGDAAALKSQPGAVTESTSN